MYENEKKGHTQFHNKQSSMCIYFIQFQVREKKRKEDLVKKRQDLYTKSFFYIMSFSCYVPQL